MLRRCATKAASEDSTAKVSISEPKTRRGRRAISLDPATVAVLPEHRRRVPQNRCSSGPDFKDLDLVLHKREGGWLWPDAVSSMFIRRGRRYDVPRLTLQGLRHTRVTLPLERGVHPRVVQELLGHSTIAITLSIDSYVSPTLHNEAAQVVAPLLVMLLLRCHDRELAPVCQAGPRGAAHVDRGPVG